MVYQNRHRTIDTIERKITGCDDAELGAGATVSPASPAVGESASPAPPVGESASTAVGAGVSSPVGAGVSPPPRGWAVGASLTVKFEVGAAVGAVVGGILLLSLIHI